MTISESMFFVLWKSLFAKGVGVRQGDKVFQANKAYVDHLRACLKDCFVSGEEYTITKTGRSFTVTNSKFELVLDKTIVRQMVIVRLLQALQECNSIKEFVKHEAVYKFLNIHRFDVHTYSIFSRKDNVVTYNVIKGKYTGLVSVDYNTERVVNQGDSKFTFDSFLFLNTKLNADELN